MHNFIDGEAGRLFLQELHGNGLLSLAMWDNGFKVMTANRPLLAPKDFTGLRFRIMPSRVLDAQFTCLGAQSKDLPFSDVYAALEQGLVDAAENTPSNIYTKRFYLVQDHLTVSNHGYLGYLVLTNEQFWLTLPEDIREILEETLTEVTLWERKIAAEHNERDLQQIIDTEEIEVYWLSENEKAEWEEALHPIYRLFIPQIGVELLQEINPEKTRAF